MEKKNQEERIQSQPNPKVTSPLRDKKADENLRMEDVILDILGIVGIADQRRLFGILDVPASDDVSMAQTVRRGARRVVVLVFGRLGEQAPDAAAVLVAASLPRRRGKGRFNEQDRIAEWKNWTKRMDGDVCGDDATRKWCWQMRQKMAWRRRPALLNVDSRGAH
ncbi:unnamed protein product [Caenorhabditis auriculariae]|uniref:Uncharacterized protein n=1 Tax=Caenorhabditis auriculariae TaxID=2777116 RepID=A0A8S1GXD1_9PELO|nr:unnamed protein product [Caenorhabditis auriculariae]